MLVSARSLTLLVMALAIAAPHRASAADGRAQTTKAVRAAAQEKSEPDADTDADEPADEGLILNKPLVSAPSATKPVVTAATSVKAKPTAAQSTTNKAAAAKPAATRKSWAASTSAERVAATAPVTASRQTTSATKPTATRSKVVRAIDTSETIPAPAGALAPGRTTSSTGPDVIYDQPDQGRMLNPSYHPARVKRYGGGWYLAGAQPAGGGAIANGEMIPAPDPIYDQGGGPAGDVYDDGDPSMGGGPYNGGGFGGGGFGGGGMGGGGMGGGGLGGGGFGGMGLGGSGLGGGGGGYSSGGVGPGFGSGKRYSVIAAAEMMWVKTRFSNAAGMGQTDFTGSGNNTQFFQTERQFNPGYQGGFRAYIGFRDNCCGDEFRLSFFNLQTVASLNGTNTNTTSYCDFLCNQAPNPGDSVSTNFRQGASIWDMECIRPFFFNPQCNDCCGPNCPVWDLRWFGGLRFAYINHYINSTVTDATNTVDGLLATAQSAFKFTGVGPRVGMQGRKYFGQSGRVSIYSRGSGALLVGSASELVQNTSHGGAGLGLTTNTLFSRNARMIPAAEIELGVTWWMLPRFAVSAGWNMQCFWDLGLQETGSMTTPPLDTSNILGFESLFLRGEMLF